MSNNNFNNVDPESLAHALIANIESVWDQLKPKKAMSKKYKLIKWYPSLPIDWKNREIIVEENSHGDFYYRNKSEVRYLKGSQVKNHPEFWEKVEEKDYKILSFTNGIINLLACSFSRDFEGDNKWKIRSVKRLSDGEVFTIGDKVREAGGKYPSEINEIKIDQDKIRIRYFRNFTSLELARKVKEPLFTTEDGVDIYKGDLDFYWVDTKDWVMGKPASKYTYPRDTENYPHFKFNKKAEKYIEENKPRYSKADIREAIKQSEIIKNLSLHISTFLNQLDNGS